MNVMAPLPARCSKGRKAPCSTDWPAQRLQEARGIVADVIHHPASLTMLACRTIAAHSSEKQERREALALLGLLIGRQGGVL